MRVLVVLDKLYELDVDDLHRYHPRERQTARGRYRRGGQPTTRRSGIFSAASLVSDPAKALLAEVTVGQSPVDLAFVDNGARLVVADSDRFYVQGGRSALSVVDPAAALAGGPASIGSIPTGLFPRQFSVEPNGSTLLVTDFDSSRLEAVSLSGLR